MVYSVRREACNKQTEAFPIKDN